MSCLNVHVIESIANPSAAPTDVGQHWINTVTGEQWFSKGIALVSDWALLMADTDVKVKVSATDTTSGYLNDELTVSNGTNPTSALEKSITSPSGDEKLNIKFDQTKIALTASQVTDFTEAAQDAVGGSLVDTDSIDFTYNDAGNQISAVVLPAGVDHNLLLNYVANRHIDHSAVSLINGTGISATGLGDLTASRTINIANTAVTASSYGSATQVATFTVNAQGQLTAAANTNISVLSSAIADFIEAAQDAIGGILTDTASIDFTYNDAGNVISAVVLPGGVDHNSLLNWVANKHIDHSAVSISAGAGLTGGGDITATRTISMPNVGTAGTYGSSTQYPVITTDAQGRVSSVTLQSNGQYWVVKTDIDNGGLLTWEDATGQDLCIRQAGSAYIRQVSSNGTLAAPTATTNGQRLGGNGYYGWSASGTSGFDILPSVAINGYASQNHTPSAQGGQLQIEIIPNGSTTPVTVATVQNDGLWDISGKRITNAADPVNPQDYVTLAYFTADSAVWIELIKTSANQTSASNTTLTAVADLAFTAVAGHTYYLEYTIRFQTASTSTGITLTLNTGTTAVGTMAAQVNLPVAADGTGALYTGSISALNDLVTSSSVEAANTNYIANIKGIFICTTGGTIQPYFRSEVNGSQVTFGQGSVALIRNF